MMEVGVAVDSLTGRIAGVSCLHIAPPYPERTLWVALFADPAGDVPGVWQETSDSS